MVAYNTKELSADQTKNVMAALTEVTQWMKDNPDKVEAFAVKGGQKPGIAKEFLTSGMVAFDVRPISDAADELRAEFSVLKDRGIISEDPPASIYGK